MKQVAVKLWRCRLCKHGPQCDHRDCVFAHHLNELLPPDETSSHYTQIWESQGVDRWFGQAMTGDQVDMIQWYYDRTPRGEIPLWVQGLRHNIDMEPYAVDIYLPWDYGLSTDLLLLRRHRRGPLPFTFTPGLWEKLEKRRQVLAKIKF